LRGLAAAATNGIFLLTWAVADGRSNFTLGGPMIQDRRLVAKGKDEPFQALLDQGRYQAKLAADQAALLAEYNWTHVQTAEMLDDLATLDTDKNRQLDARAAARASTRGEAAAITEAKALITKMRNVARQVVRKNADAGVAVNDFDAGVPLGRVASRISSYLSRLKVPAAKLDTAFAPFFKNQPLTHLLDAARTRLDTASTSQEVDLAGLPEDTAALYERKGHLLEAIEDLNAVARNAFSDAPETRAKFNKDILNRGRKAKPPTDPTPGPTPAPPTPDAPTPS